MSKMIYGMNGHAAYLGGNPWQTVYTPQMQLSYLKELGSTYYRNDCASAFMAGTLVDLFNGPVFKNQGIKLLPVLNPKSVAGYNPQGTESEGYKLGFTLAQGVAQKVNGICDVIECGNELDAPLPWSFKVKGDGRLADDWDQSGWGWYRGCIRGMIEGVKSVNPKIKCGVDHGIPMAFKLLQMLRAGEEPNGKKGAPPVVWDITMMHWYHSSGDPMKAGGGGKYGPQMNALAELAKLGQPIWITEMGWSGSRDNDTDASTWMKQTMAEYLAVRDQYKIEAMFHYCLIDKDGQFGLLQYDGKTKRPMYQVYKDFVRANPTT